MPVLPEVGSRIVWPGRIRPFSSASSISERATRSLTEPVGLEDSILAQMRTPGLGLRPLELDERRVADRLHDVAVATPAGPILKRRGRHQSTECRPAAWRPLHLACAILSYCPSGALDMRSGRRAHARAGLEATARRAAGAPCPARRAGRDGCRRRRTSRGGRALAAHPVEYDDAPGEAPAGRADDARVGARSAAELARRDEAEHAVAPDDRAARRGCRACGSSRWCRAPARRSARSVCARRRLAIIRRPSPICRQPRVSTSKPAAATWRHRAEQDRVADDQRRALAAAAGVCRRVLGRAAGERRRGAGREHRDERERDRSRCRAGGPSLPHAGHAARRAAPAPKRLASRPVRHPRPADGLSHDRVRDLLSDRARAVVGADEAPVGVEAVHPGRLLRLLQRRQPDVLPADRRR